MEFFIAVLGLPVLGAGALMLGVFWVFKRTRPLCKKFGITLLVMGAIYLAVVTGVGDIYRQFRAKAIIQQAQPLISAIDKYKEAIGSYPPSLEKLVPTYISNVPYQFIYKEEANSFSLRFWLDGPPFGHHFIYQPSRIYPDWWENTFQFKKRINDWGWYLKV